jgi:cytochrome c oxidase cbb3-type subunit 3
VTDSATANGAANDSLASVPSSTLPSTITVADSGAGDRLFHGKGRCFTCHGERGQGTPRLGPSLTDSEWLAGNGSLTSIEYVIAHGVAVPRASSVGMPAYSDMLDSSEIALTAAYVYALAHPGSTMADSATHPANDSSRATDAAERARAPEHVP